MPLVPVGDTPTLIFGEPTDWHHDFMLVLQNRGNATIDIGGSDVASGEGESFAAGDKLRFVYSDSGKRKLRHGDIYGITASGTVNVSVWRARKT